MKSRRTWYITNVIDKEWACLAVVPAVDVSTTGTLWEGIFVLPSQSYRIFPAHPPPGLRPKLIPIQRKPMLDSSCMNMPIRISPDIVRQ